jgi:hypothetical protein
MQNVHPVPWLQDSCCSIVLYYTFRTGVPHDQLRLLFQLLYLQLGVKEYLMHPTARSLWLVQSMSTTTTSTWTVGDSRQNPMTDLPVFKVILVKLLLVLRSIIPMISAEG